MRGPRGTFWVATSARLVTDDKGKPIALEGLTRDISQQRAVFNELGQGAALFEAFAVGADIGVAVSTSSGNEIFLNDRMRELLDIAPAQTESSSILERMSPELQAVSPVPAGRYGRQRGPAKSSSRLQVKMYGAVILFQ